MRQITDEEFDEYQRLKAAAPVVPDPQTIQQIMKLDRLGTVCIITSSDRGLIYRVSGPDPRLVELHATALRHFLGERFRLSVPAQ